jgi:chemotaxis protein MotB
MDDHQTPVPIIVKKKKGHGGHHGGAWKVAYADFVTAMMAFFIVLWIVGQSNAVKQSISMYFKDPGVFENGRGGGILDGSSGSAPSPTSNAAIEMEKLKVEAKKIGDAIASTPEFDKFKDKIQITVTKEGLRIELVENSTDLFFDVGSAQIKPETVKLLKLVALEIGRLKNNVMIEGYTDSRPYRANTARRILEENGVRQDQVLQVRGFADRNLKHPQQPMDSANRRVSILVAATPENIAQDIAPPKPQAAPEKPSVLPQTAPVNVPQELNSK